MPNVVTLTPTSVISKTSQGIPLGGILVTPTGVSFTYGYPSAGHSEKIPINPVTGRFIEGIATTYGGYQPTGSSDVIFEAPGIATDSQGRIFAYLNGVVASNAVTYDPTTHEFSGSSIVGTHTDSLPGWAMFVSLTTLGGKLYVELSNKGEISTNNVTTTVTPINYPPEGVSTSAGYLSLETDSIGIVGVDIPIGIQSELVAYASGSSGTHNLTIPSQSSFIYFTGRGGQIGERTTAYTSSSTLPKGSIVSASIGLPGNSIYAGKPNVGLEGLNGKGGDTVITSFLPDGTVSNSLKSNGGVPAYGESGRAEGESSVPPFSESSVLTGAGGLKGQVGKVPGGGGGGQPQEFDGGNPGNGGTGLALIQWYNLRDLSLVSPVEFPSTFWDAGYIPVDRLREYLLGVSITTATIKKDVITQYENAITACNLDTSNIFRTVNGKKCYTDMPDLGEGANTPLGRPFFEDILGFTSETFSDIEEAQDSDGVDRIEGKLRNNLKFNSSGVTNIRVFMQQYFSSRGIVSITIEHEAWGYATTPFIESFLNTEDQVGEANINRTTTHYTLASANKYVYTSDSYGAELPHITFYNGSGLVIPVDSFIADASLAMMLISKTSFVQTIDTPVLVSSRDSGGGFTIMKLRETFNITFTSWVDSEEYIKYSIVSDISAPRSLYTTQDGKFKNIWSTLFWAVQDKDILSSEFGLLEFDGVDFFFNVEDIQSSSLTDFIYTLGGTFDITIVEKDIKGWKQFLSNLLRFVQWTFGHAAKIITLGNPFVIAFVAIVAFIGSLLSNNYSFRELFDIGIDIAIDIVSTVLITFASGGTLTIPSLIGIAVAGGTSAYNNFDELSDDKRDDAFAELEAQQAKLDEQLKEEQENPQAGAQDYMTLQVESLDPFREVAAVTSEVRFNPFDVDNRNFNPYDKLFSEN